MPVSGPHTPALHTSGGVQPMHAAPVLPHFCEVVLVTHTVPSQQPAQFDGEQVPEVVHWPFTQFWPFKQVVHMPPSRPQAEALVPSRQLPVVEVQPMHVNAAQLNFT